VLEHIYPIHMGTGVLSEAFSVVVKKKNLHSWTKAEKRCPRSIKGRERMDAKVMKH